MREISLDKTSCKGMKGGEIIYAFSKERDGCKLKTKGNIFFMGYVKQKTIEVFPLESQFICLKSNLKID